MIILIGNQEKNLQTRWLCIVLKDTFLFLPLQLKQYSTAKNIQVLAYYIPWGKLSSDEL